MTYDVMTYDAMTYDVMTYNVMTYDVMTYDVMEYDVITRSVLIEIAWSFLRLVRNIHGEEGVSKNQNFQLKIGYNSGCNMKYTWL